MRSLTAEEAKQQFSDWHEQKAPLLAVFLWASPDSFESVLTGVGDDWIVLAGEGKGDIRLPLSGANFKEREARETLIKDKGSSRFKYVRCMEIAPPGSPKVLIFERQVH